MIGRALRTLVHNEAMKDDPIEIYGFRIYVLVCSVSALGCLNVWLVKLRLYPTWQACFGGMVFGMDTGTIGGVLQMPAFQK